MGWKRIPVKCTLCEEETALVGEDINKTYAVDFFERNGWKFSKYKTMCPKCAKKEKEKYDQLAMQLEGGEHKAERPEPGGAPGTEPDRPETDAAET